MAATRTTATTPVIMPRRATSPAGSEPLRRRFDPEGLTGAEGSSAAGPHARSPAGRGNDQPGGQTTRR